MKTLKILSLAIFTLMIASCSKNDDTVVIEEVTVELTTAQLLASGPWLVENITGSTMNDCNRQSNFDFTDGEYMIYESYRMNSGSCEYDGSEVYSYTLSGMLIILEHSGVPMFVFTIDAISESQLLLSMGSGGGSDVYTLRK